jgi:hypothetical protein
MILKAVLIAALISGLACAPQALAFGKKPNENIHYYPADLAGNGSRNIVTVEDNFAADKSFVLAVGRKNKKLLEQLDSLVIAGKIVKLELTDLNENGRKQIVLHFVGPDSLFCLMVYQMEADRLDNIFSVKSRRPIAADFSGIPRIKARNDSGTESWFWSGEKFVKE